jgi:hypothetical protein
VLVLPNSTRPETRHARARLLSLLERITPAVVLIVLSPIVAEYLLADFTVRNLDLLIVFIPLYGCGALLIREVARRARRGWPTILLLAAAYAMIEEAFLTQSLFNPNYVGQRLLDYGYIPAIGTSLNWTLFVLSIHVVWSVATPTLIVEGLAADRRTEPWLKRPGLALVGLLFTLGSAATMAYSLKMSDFVASRAQFVTSAVLVALTIVTAFRINRRVDGETYRSSRQPQAPPAWSQALLAFLLASAYLVVEPLARSHGQPPWVGLVARTACEAVAVWLIIRWARRQGWGPLHYLALGAGTTLTYLLFGLSVVIQGHTNLGVPTNAIDIAGQIGLGLGVLGLIAWGAYGIIASPRSSDL